MATEAINLSGETKGKAAQVAEGFWIIATGHHPGGSLGFPEINNRCLVMRLQEAGTPVLVVFNGTEPSAIPEVKRIEQEQGVAVKYIVSPGGGHHVLMPPWHDAFENATILLPPARIPRTAGGKKLMGLPRVKLLDPDAPLSQFAGQIDVVLFRGVNAMHDHPSPGEGGPDGFLTMMGMMYKMMFKMTDPIDELWVHHIATGTVIGGENLGWMFPAEVRAKAPFMVKSMLKPDPVFIFTTPRKVADRAMVSACWNKILSWPAKTVMTYHDTPGFAFQGDGQAALRSAVQAAGQLS
ncbi:MAG TPA: hypothetical protein VL137_06480 [Polyangiaceae bacterium]|nr:hypothetical protein [Polyangiaceae bacterium]